MSKTARSFALVGASWKLLGRDPKLLLLPLGSLVCTSAVAAGFFFAGLFHGVLSEGSHLDGYLALYAFYAIAAFIGICFNATLVAVALRRLDGEPATIADGWAMVRGRLPEILRWALLAATVGIVLRVIQERTGILGRVAGIIGSIAWGLVTFFVVPVLLFEPVDVRGAIRRSASIFRKRWGEQLVGNLTIGLALMIVVIPVMVVGLGLVLVSPAIGIGTMVVGFLALMVFASALGEVFNAALYRYAVAGTVPDGFTSQDFEAAVKHRKSWPWRARSIPPRPDR